MPRPDLLLFVCGLLSAALYGCSAESALTATSFGTLADGREATLYRLTNSSGAWMEVCDYGARIISIHVPDRTGNLGDVIVGCHDLKEYEQGRDRFIGCVLGRFANRINGASFSIDSTVYHLDANEQLDGTPVHLHGGYDGFDRKLWDADMVCENGCNGVRMHYHSPDGECGYPGNLDCSVTYWWTDENVCKVEYEASTDAPTIVNLSNHSYFNLKGEKAGYVLDHLFEVYADSCIQNNLQYCPDMTIAVEGTPFDFRKPQRLDYRIDMPHPHLQIMKGMSACWKLNGWDGSLRKAAKLVDPGSGRGVEVWTTEPALLTYTGRGFDGSIKGKYGPIQKFDGMVLETLHFADTPNQSLFPSCKLLPGEKFYSSTEWRFFSE